MTDPTQFQILIIGLILVGGICAIIIGCTLWYGRDIQKHPEKHKDDFKLRSNREVKE